MLDLKYLKEEIEREERQRSQVAKPKYTHVATHGETGHKVGSHDGVTWFDHETGKPLK